MRVVFLGTPDFAVPTLHALCATHDVVAVVTQPDRPSGRGKKLAPPPVKEAALEYGIPVYQFEKLNCQEAKDLMVALAPDVAVVVAYGQLLKPWMLDLPRFGCLNIHGSLLPRWRGAAPIHWAIVKGDQETGVTIQQMDVGLDTGPVLLKRSLPIAEGDTFKSIYNKLKMEGGLLLLEALEGLELGTLVPEPQDDALSCYAPLISREMAAISWEMPARAIANHIRGFDDWPAAFTLLDGERIKCFSPSVVAPSEVLPQVAASQEATALSSAPGTILGLSEQGLVVMAGDGMAVAIGEVQAPNGKRLPVKAFLAGHPLAPGTRFEAYSEAGKGH